MPIWNGEVARIGGNLSEWVTPWGRDPRRAKRYANGEEGMRVRFFWEDAMRRRGIVSLQKKKTMIVLKIKTRHGYDKG